jgi:hypothetical protein
VSVVGSKEVHSLDKSLLPRPNSHAVDEHRSSEITLGEHLRDVPEMAAVLS